MTTKTILRPAKVPAKTTPASKALPVQTERPSYQWAVPPELGIPVDPLRLRLDIHHQAMEMTWYEGDTVQHKIVAARDVAQALASEMTFATGFLPPESLWWCNTKSGPVTAIYQKPKIWKLALQVDIKKPAKRFTVPLPGLVFLCSPGRPPWVYAVKKRPVKITDIVYKAPLANIYADGRSCPGSHKYPMDINQMIDSFFKSFFSAAANLEGRSVMFPKDITHLWEFLDKKDKFPMDDLVRHAYVGDLMRQEMRQ